MTAYSAVYDQTPSYIKDRLQNYVTGPSGLAGGSSIEAQKYPLVFTASVFGGCGSLTLELAHIFLDLPFS